jgi:hypothetical protein
VCDATEAFSAWSDSGVAEAVVFDTGGRFVVVLPDRTASAPVARDAVLDTLADLWRAAFGVVDGWADARYASGSWDPDDVASLVSQRCAVDGRHLQFFVDDTWLEAAGESARLLLDGDFDEAIAEVSWDAGDDAGSPGAAGSGCYHLFRFGARRYDVLHASDGETSHEETFHAASRAQALEEFHARYGENAWA